MKIHVHPDVDYVIGIDEAGRGPLAGPVSVGLVAIPSELYKDVLDDFVRLGLRDSKQLSAKAREEFFIRLKSYSQDDLLFFTKSFVHAHVIDRVGIAKAIRMGIRRGISRLALEPEKSFVYLDGALSAPEEYRQATVIKGDEKIPIVSLASIVAKVTRDAYMERAEKLYPEYSFCLHKGYGTKKHRDEIKEHGFSKIHRRSFCGRCF